MAESFIGNIFEFLIGLFIVGFLVNFIGGIIVLFGLPYLGIVSEADFELYSIISLYIVQGIALATLFATRKAVAFGFLVDMVLQILFF